ncbi:hypothetical protein DFP72DRAFT_840666 [Ephemerocybe angulata]|uniref:Uncharacterized protein n=1 Tax=Ephemerocybe angulata TaxID=980116 RepID=A0A8H6MBV5_9AGAR|nr:hypothetical protein DFP72DRAFT_840666 [Tulosesus angulatus]
MAGSESPSSLPPLRLLFSSLPAALPLATPTPALTLYNQARRVHPTAPAVVVTPYALPPQAHNRLQLSIFTITPGINFLNTILLQTLAAHNEASQFRLQHRRRTSGHGQCRSNCKAYLNVQEQSENLRTGARTMAPGRARFRRFVIQWVHELSNNQQRTPRTVTAYCLVPPRFDLTFALCSSSALEVAEHSDGAITKSGTSLPLA